jgi:hypothetical protein
MLFTYLFCLVVGGIFVLMAAIAGSHDLDLDTTDFDVDLHPDTDIELTEGPREDNRATRTPPSPLEQWGSWLLSILTSLKFWTFGIGFFGLTGVVLSALQLTLSEGWIAAISTLMGLICGTTTAALYRTLQKRQVNSLIRSTDFVGLIGTVTLPITKISRGKVRLCIKGTTLEAVAYTDHPTELSLGVLVLVVGTERDRVWVVPEVSLGDTPETLQG